MSSNDEISDVLAAFYDKRRAWTSAEEGAAASLVKHHGWTPSRAGFIATWLDGDPFWKSKATTINDVLRNIEKIAAESSKPKVVGGRFAEPEPARPYADPYHQGDKRDPEDKPPGRDIDNWLAGVNFTTQAARERSQAQVDRIRDKIKAAQAKGLKGPALFESVVGVPPSFDAWRGAGEEEER